MKSILFCFLTLYSLAISAQQLDIQGHRGCRGLLPENTIPAFVKALDLGVTSIQLDVVISKDGQVVVNYGSFLNPDLCLTSSGDSLKNELQFNLYEMDYEDIFNYDCGGLGNIQSQEKTETYIPLLSDVIKKVEWHIKSYTQYEVDYVITIMSSKKGDGIHHPKPEVFTKIVYSLIDKYLPWDRVVIQSNDFRVLKYWHKAHSKVQLGVKIDNLKSVATNLANLGFSPTSYSINHELVTEEKIIMLNKKDIKVIPWSVNDTTRMKEIISWGASGFITDYPNRAQKLGYITSKKEE